MDTNTLPRANRRSQMLAPVQDVGALADGLEMTDRTASRPGQATNGSDHGLQPLEQKGIPVDDQLRNWSELNVEPYDKNAVESLPEGDIRDAFTQAVDQVLPQEDEHTAGPRRHVAR